MVREKEKRTNNDSMDRGSFSLYLKKYRRAIDDIQKAKNLDEAIGALNELRETFRSRDQLLFQNCTGWIKQAKAKKRKRGDKHLLEQLRNKNGIVIRVKYAKEDLLNYFRECLSGRIIYENYADVAVRKGIDFVIRRKNGKCTFLNVYHKTRNANFIGSYLGAVKILERKLNIQYPVYYVAPRYTPQTVKALLAVDIIKPLWFEYDKYTGTIKFHSNLASQPESFFSEKAYFDC